nr:hypothetical protein [Tanacetum cinerariifolium]GFC93014.1 hypothetical protein [Tanacetum cinerariifolium]
MGYEHLSITPETKSDEVTESNAENLLCEVALEDKKECDLLIYENSLVCDNSDNFFDSKIDDDISLYDDDFEDIEYVEASVPDPAIVSVEEENVVQREEGEVDLEEISQVQDVVPTLPHASSPLHRSLHHRCPGSHHVTTLPRCPHHQHHHSHHSPASPPLDPPSKHHRFHHPSATNPSPPSSYRR